jgi:hypothetical protein
MCVLLCIKYNVLKFLLFWGVVVFVARVSADNLLVNPCFDETPWDTGWTVEGDSGDGYISATPDTENYFSPPRSCQLVAATGWDNPAYISLYQEIPPARCCTCEAYFQNIDSSSGLGHTGVDIYIKINDEYVREWWAGGSNSVWTKWGKIYDTNNIVSGIKFVILSYIGMHASWGHGIFRIDNVYISGTTVGVEEEPIKSEKVFEVYPNPFTTQTTIYYSLNEIESDRANNNCKIIIYNLSGRVIREFNHLITSPFGRVIWDGENAQGNAVPLGIYFIQLGTSRRKPQYPTQKLIRF